MCVYISFMHQDYVDTYMYIYMFIYTYISMQGYHFRNLQNLDKSWHVQICCCASSQLSVGLLFAPGPSIFLSSSLSPGNGQPPGLPFTVIFIFQHISEPWIPNFEGFSIHIYIRKNQRKTISIKFYKVYHSLRFLNNKMGCNQSHQHRMARRRWDWCLLTNEPLPRNSTWEDCPQGDLRSMLVKGSDP